MADAVLLLGGHFAKGASGLHGLEDGVVAKTAGTVALGENVPFYLAFKLVSLAIENKDYSGAKARGSCPSLRPR